MSRVSRHRGVGLVEDGLAEMDDLLKDRISTLKGDRDRSREALARARGNMKARAEVTAQTVARFGELTRQRLLEKDTPGRKALLSAMIDRIDVYEDKIHIRGRKEVLEQCVIAAAGGREGVRTFIPKWRTR